MIGLNYRDSRPIYEQIKDNYRKLIASGAMAPGEKLPSVRELASQLAINPNTIQRAYRELEGDGFIYTIPGKGCFVGSEQEVDRGRMNQLLTEFDSIIEQLTLIGVSCDELIRRISEKGGKEE